MFVQNIFASANMVRERARAQRSLSPSKPSEKKRRKRCVDNDNEKIVETIDPDADEYEDARNGDLEISPDMDEIPQDPASEGDDIVENCYNKLPDFNTLPEELSEKTKTYWTAVEKDYTDFMNWTCLLQTVAESEDNIAAARGAYNCFLRYYPYCYGYWKKFSDIEKKHGNLENAKEIFSRGVKAIHVSIDLWVHYLNFTIQQNKGKENGRDVIRQLFNEAIDAAGMEFKSHKLWDAYIEWEKSLGNLKRVTEIYDKLISTPTQHYLKNWEKFKNHLESHTLSDILPTEEYVQLMQRIDAIPPGMMDDEEPSVITTEHPGKSKTSDSDHHEDKEIKKGERRENDPIKNKVIAERESIFVETAGEIKKRWKYEEAIKRPYFHVKPLEKSQIKNWKEYLDYEMRQGGHKRICFLFERCVVACALYEEFWEKYIDYIEPRDQVAARRVYSRACNIHLIKKYNINMSWATFEERNKNYSQAANILSNIDKNFPGMILITMRRVGLARRMSKHSDIVRIYENAIEKSERIEDKIFYSIKYSHVLAKTLDNKTKARDVLWKALQLGKKQNRLYLQLLDLETHYGALENEYASKLFNTVANDVSLSDDFRETFAQHKVEFYEEYGDDIEKILQVKEHYEVEHKRQEAIKRQLSNSSSMESTIKIPKNDLEVSQTGNSADNQWYNKSSEGVDYASWSNYAAQYANFNQQQQH